MALTRSFDDKSASKKQKNSKKNDNNEESHSNSADLSMDQHSKKTLNYRNNTSCMNLGEDVSSDDEYASRGGSAVVSNFENSVHEQ